jgi:hypothetical protein
MRVHRGSLFWGIFFLLLGGIPLAARQGLIDAASLPDLGQLWPLALIVVGVLILVSRTQFALLGTIGAGAVLGALVGGAIAGGGFALNIGDCGGENRSNLQHLARNGTLETGAALDLDFNCGTLGLSVGPGDAWSLGADYRGDPPLVDAGPGQLSIRTPRDGGRRHEWTIVAPRERLSTIDVRHNAGSARLDVTGTTLSRLKVEANAGEVILIADDGEVSGLDVSINAGQAKLDLRGPVDGVVRVNAGAVDLCVPADAELRLTVPEQLTFATNLDDRELSRNGDLWQRAGSGGPVVRLEVTGNAASFDLDPTGGCR